MDSVLRLLGIARKGGRVEVGEEPVGASARARQAKLILVAADAAENTVRRAAHFAEAGKVPCLRVPHTKAGLGDAVGRSSCAMLALTDVGLAAAVAEKLAAEDGEQYGPAAGELREKAGKALQRQKEQRAHEKKLQRQGKKPWAPPPRQPAEKPAAKVPEAPARRPVPKGRLTIKKKTP